jgi:hypothetical protein
MGEEASVSPRTTTMGPIDETQLASAFGSMLAALNEQTSPLAALLGASTGGPPAALQSSLPAPTAPTAEPSGPTRGATAAMGEGVRADELLVRAASRGDLAMVRSLLDRGAVAAARNHYLLTALHWAVTLGHTQVVELLLDRGTPLDVLDAEGQTPLHMAAREGDEQMVTLLIERGAVLALPAQATRDAINRKGCGTRPAQPNQPSHTQTPLLRSRMSAARGCGVEFDVHWARRLPRSTCPHTHTPSAARHT